MDLLVALHLVFSQERERESTFFLSIATTAKRRVTEAHFNLVKSSGHVLQSQIEFAPLSVLWNRVDWLSIAMNL